MLYMLDEHIILYMLYMLHEHIILYMLYMLDEHFILYMLYMLYEHFILYMLYMLDEHIILCMLYMLDEHINIQKAIASRKCTSGCLTGAKLFTTYLLTVLVRGFVLLKAIPNTLARI